jgi:outer membrane protein TolC
MGAANIYNGGVSNILPRWAIGVGVSFKLFDGLNRENRYLAAKEVAQEVEQIAIKAHDDINLLIEELYNQLLNYHNHIISINSSIRFAEEYHQAKEIAFKEGWTTASDLIDAELNLAKARIERLEAAFNYDVTLAKLLEASGISIKFTDYIQQDIIQTIK